jgi:hypothetical protein
MSAKTALVAGVDGRVTLPSFCQSDGRASRYGLATVFITPLAILLVEAGQGSVMAPQQLMQARLLDTVVGCMLGLAASACIHSSRFRAVVGAGLRRMWPDDKPGAQR